MNNIIKTRLLHIWNKLHGVPLEWDLGDYRKILDRINDFDLEELSNDDLKSMASRLTKQAREGVPLGDLMVETYALVRESSRRVIGLRPFDTQVIAGIAMHQGKVIELGTGEGKTLAAVFPVCLNALTGKGVHIHTFNDYLASRDADWMGPIYRVLGLSVGCIQEGMSTEERRNAWACDITYTTSREAGFDYLRDHLCYENVDLVHRDFHFAIIDEADSMLIDEARVPLVIAGRTGKTESTSEYLGNIARALKETIDFETDDGNRNVNLTDHGLKKVEEVMDCENLYAPENFELLTRVNLALHAEHLIHRDIDYIVREGKIKIVDEFTGRVVEDRHWPDDLQAAVEAKERLRRGSGGSILGSITLQQFLRFYSRLSGMTATARSAASEIHRFYDMKTVVIPQN
ncbi:MAG: hypothetical protein KOO63_02495, partial [Bacteroidales bacterium]|nr:hypothetical protein [Candidatus Latescibacterota bacterium]